MAHGKAEAVGVYLCEWVIGDDADRSSGGTSIPTAPIWRFDGDADLGKTHKKAPSTLTEKSPKRKKL